MTSQDRLARLNALEAALHKGAAKPDVWFSFLLPTPRPGPGLGFIIAACVLGLEGEPDAVAALVFERYQALVEQGRPAKAVGHWIAAGLGLRFGVEAAEFAQTGRQSRHGVEAMIAHALIVPPRPAFERLEEVHKAIRPGFLNLVTGLGAACWAYSAAIVARGEGAGSAKSALERARAALKADRDAKKASKVGALACVGLGLDPGALIARYRALREAVRDHKPLKRLKPDSLMEWAAFGVRPDHLEALAAFRADKRKVSLSDRVEARLALLFLAQGDANLGDDAHERAAVITAALSAREALVNSGGDGGGDGGDGGDGGGGE